MGPADYDKQQDLFTTSTARLLRNKGKYPIVLSTSCYTVSFDNYVSIGEALLMEPDKGAVAVSGTAWKSQASADHFFHEYLMRMMYQGKAKRIGDAILAAKQEIFDKKYRFDIEQSLILLGDPALLVYHPVMPAQ